MFDSHKSDLKIISPEGNIRSIERGLVDRKQIIIENTKAVILVGDEIRRTLPNGLEETFEVLDPVCYTGMLAHYEVIYRRKGAFPSGTGGNLTFNVTGPNARVNFNSHDESRNIATGDNVFADLKQKIEADVSDAQVRSRLLSLIEDMEKNANNRSAFTASYQQFISAAANHMTLIAPFLPAITNLLN
jgi:hypothetical protein